jgi:hypothetical protein
MVQDSRHSFRAKLVRARHQESARACFCCEHPNAVWLTKHFAGRDVDFCEEARQVFLACENDTRALCFAGVLGGTFDEVLRAADLGNAFAQAWMAGRTVDEEFFHWAEKSAAQGERDGFFWLGQCYRDGTACEKDAERATEIFLVAAELGHFYGIVSLGEVLDKDDPQRFVWFGRAAASSGGSALFWKKVSDQIFNFNCGTGHAKVVCHRSSFERTHQQRGANDLWERFEL